MLTKSEIEANPWLDRPVLVTGQMKTGGTLFQGMLDGSPEMLVLPEPMFFRLLSQRAYRDSAHRAMDWLVGNRSVLIQPSQEIEGFYREDETQPVPFQYASQSIDDLELKGEIRGASEWFQVFDLEVFHQKLKSYLMHGAASGVFVMQATALAFLKAVKPGVIDSSKLKRWAFREIYTAQASPFSPVVRKQNNSIESFLDWFPDGTILFQVRDPRAVTLSRMNHFKQRRPSGVLHELRHLLCDAVIARESLAQLREIQGKTSRIIPLRYEDLVSHPEQAMTETAKKLDISFHENLTRPTVLGLSNKVITAFDYNGAQVTDSRINRWKQLSGHRRLLTESMLYNKDGFIGAHWGYQPEFSSWISDGFRRTIGAVRIMQAHQLRRWPYQLRHPFKFYGLSAIFTLPKTSRGLDDSGMTPSDAMYSEPAFSTRVNELENRLAQKDLNISGHILDVRPEHGLWAAAMARRSQQVVILEPEPQQAQIYEAFIKKHQIRNVSVTMEIPTDEQGFDLVHARGFLERRDADPALNDLISQTRDGGYVYLSFPGPARPLLDAGRFLVRRRLAAAWGVMVEGLRSLIQNRILNNQSYPVSWLTRKGFETMLAHHGLQVERLDFAYSSADRWRYPARLGPFRREYDALCKREEA